MPDIEEFPVIDEVPVEESSPLAKPIPDWQLTPQGQKPYLGQFSGGGFSAYQPENMQEAADLLRSLSEPAISIPRIQGRSVLGKLGAAPVNVASGLVEGLESPVGAAATLAGGPVVKGLFAGLAAKEAGRALGESSVTKDPQQIAEGLLGAGVAPWIALSGSLPKGVPDAVKTRIEPENNIIEYPRVEESGLQPAPERGDSTERIEATQGQEEKVTPTVTETTPPVPIEELPATPTQTGLRPAIRLVGGKVVPGDAGITHADIIKANDIKAEDVDQRGFVNEKGEFQDREQAADQTQLPTNKEEDRLHSTDLPEAKAEVVGMGGAAREEIPETGAGGEKYGVAERIREERAKAGQVEPVQPGEGISTPDSIEQGRAILAQNPQAGESAMTAFEADPQKKISSEGVAVVRAHGEELAKRTRAIEGQFGTESPEYKAAFDALSAWDKRSKVMQTEWHKAGMAQQGWTDLDTGSFTGLQREYTDRTGKEFTPKQKKQAEEIAGAVRKAEEATGQAQAEVNEEIKKSTPKTTDAEKRALDAAWKTVRENAIRIANLENKSRTTEEIRKKAIEDVEKEANARAAKAVTQQAKDAAIKAAKDEMKAGVEKAKRDAETAKIELKREQKALDAAQKRVTSAAADLAEAERKRLADPSISVWERAREYLNQGVNSFDEIRNKIATDLGMKVEKVTKLLAGTKPMKPLTDELWRRQLNERNLKEKARRWVDDADSPAYEKFIKAIPRSLFAIRVGFHGTVALGTHAPAVAFQPPFWSTYITDFGKMYKMVGSPAYYESQVQNLVRRPNYTTALRAGLVVDPFKYEDFNNPKISQAFGRLTGMGNRGYFVLKILRQDMFDQHWGNLPKHVQIPEVAKALADNINHITGVVKVGAPPGANLVLFAPRLEMSRAAFLFGDPIRMVRTLANWEGSSIGEQQFALRELKSKAWVAGTAIGLLALNQGMLSATDSNQKVNFTDPFKSDWMKFKVAGMNVSYGNPLITMARIPIRVSVAASSSGGKLKNLIYPDEDIYKMLGEYGRSQLSPFASLITDQLTREDFARKQLGPGASVLGGSNRPMPKRLRMQGVQPYTASEYWIQQGLPIPFQEGLREVWKEGFGLSDQQIEQYMKGFGSTMFMGLTGGRVAEDVPYQTNR